MPERQWLEGRRFMQGEMQQLRDKLTIAERTAKSEAQLKEKYQLRLKVLEGTLRGPPSGGGRPTPDGGSVSNGPSSRQSLGGSENLTYLSNGLSKRTPTSHSRPSLTSGTSTILKHAKGSSRSFDCGTRSLDRGSRIFSSGMRLSCFLNKSKEKIVDDPVTHTKECCEEKVNDLPCDETEDSVSGVLYGMLQKEVIALRKASYEKDQSLKDKDDAIEMLSKKVETLTKAMEVEAKKMREVAAMEKEVAAIRVEKEQEIRGQAAWW